MKKFLFELLMFLLGLVGVAVFAVAFAYFVFCVPYGQKILFFLVLFAVFRLSAELIIEWVEEKKKNKRGEA